MERLFLSPSPFHSPENLSRCYITDKGKKRLNSARSVKIPKKAQYVVDKVVRKYCSKSQWKKHSSMHLEQVVGTADSNLFTSPEKGREGQPTTGQASAELLSPAGSSKRKANTLGYDEWYLLKERERHYK